MTGNFPDRLEVNVNEVMHDFVSHSDNRGSRNAIVGYPKITGDSPSSFPNRLDQMRDGKAKIVVAVEAGFIHSSQSC